MRRQDGEDRHGHLGFGVDNKVEIRASLPAEVALAVNAEDRLAVLHGLEMLDTAAAPDFDRITSLAAAVMQAPTALVTLVDIERQWFKSCFGLDESETATGISFCAHAIAAGDEPMVVTDATTDPRFKTITLVTGMPHVRFYDGAPTVVASPRRRRC